MRNSKRSRTVVKSEPILVASSDAPRFNRNRSVLEKGSNATPTFKKKNLLGGEVGKLFRQANRYGSKPGAILDWV